MAKSRDNYQVSGNNIEEIKTSLNFLLQRFADRMDKIEGIRGTSEVHSDLDLNQNQIVDLKSSTTPTDGVNQSELSDQGTNTTDSPTFQSVTLSANLTVAGTTTMTGAATANGGLTTTTLIASGLITANAGIQATTIDSTQGFTFTDSSSTVIHQMGGV